MTPAMQTMPMNGPMSNGMMPMAMPMMGGGSMMPMGSSMMPMAMPMMAGMMPMSMMPMMNGAAQMLGMMNCRMTCEMTKDGMTCKMMPMDAAQMDSLKACCDMMNAVMAMGAPCVMMCNGCMLVCTR